MSIQSTTNRFIPANIIEYDTQPEFTLSDKLRNNIIRDIRAEERDPNLYLIVKIVDYVFNKSRMGYDVIAEVVQPQ